LDLLEGDFYEKTEDIVDILYLKKQGMSIRKIARRTGMSRNTVRRYLHEGMEARNYPERKQPSILTPYYGHIDHWLSEDSLYQATWIFDRLRQVGYIGSYEIVKRKVRELREKLIKKAYLAFESEPGRQAQVDFGEFQVQRMDGTVDKYYVFAMILGYSRRLYAEFIERCDMVNFLDCHIRAFEYFGGVPLEILYDRMRNVYIGKLAGKDEFTASLLSLAVHYGFKPLVAPAYAPWVKGKIERPMDYIRENFWRGYEFRGLESSNLDLQTWLAVKEQRVHGTTHERVDERFVRERPLLGSLPMAAMDTSYRLYRQVHKNCLVYFEGNRYMVPHELVDARVILRVKDGVLRVFSGNQLRVTYQIPEGKGHLVQDPLLVQALRNDAEQNRRKYTSYQRHKGRAKHTISPERPLYDLEVMVRPLSDYEAYGEAV
jgi:transposase